MLTPIQAHIGRPVMPHDLWSAWNLDPIVVMGLALTGWLYWTGARHRGNRPALRRSGFFAAGLATIAAALLSPIDALATVLVTGHMLQHLLLIMVAAPLIVIGDPATVMRGLPRGVRKSTGRWRHEHGFSPARISSLHHPVTIFLATTGAIWFWHASVAYEAAANNHILHALEHASFLLTAILFWNVLLSRKPSSRLSPGASVLLIFAVAMQGVILSALLTFGDTIWYPSYEATTRSWSLHPIDDQRLAGLLMWIPGGLLYTAAALRSLGSWLRLEGGPRFRRPQDRDLISSVPDDHSGR
jgi:putative membrane protein